MYGLKSGLKSDSPTVGVLSHWSVPGMPLQLNAEVLLSSMDNSSAAAAWCGGDAGMTDLLHVCDLVAGLSPREPHEQGQAGRNQRFAAVVGCVSPTRCTFGPHRGGDLCPCRLAGAGETLPISFDSGYEPHVGEPGRERWLGYTANNREYGLMLRHREPRPWRVFARRRDGPCGPGPHPVPGLAAARRSRPERRASGPSDARPPGARAREGRGVGTSTW
jgi:hypothetical protein